MPEKFPPTNFSKLTTYSIGRRKHKAEQTKVARLPQPGASAVELIDSLPDYLGAKALRSVVEAISTAVRKDRPVAVGMGAHLVKVGCGPIIVDLMKRGIIKAIACNGATAIHDAELAMGGETSEEVADTIRNGTFGMVRETLELFTEIVAFAGENRCGLGFAVGEVLLSRNAQNRDASIFTVARKLDIPVCVFVAMGTDTIHVSPKLDAAALGESSMHDFKTVCSVVANLGAKEGETAGGVWLNIGSAVVMPEVFLKAVSVARNLGANLDAMKTANFDMIRHYRPVQNVVTRPVERGYGFEITGQHEIVLPLLRQAIIESLSGEEGQ